MTKEYTLLRRIYARLGFLVLCGVVVGGVATYVFTPRVVEVELAFAQELKRLTYTGLASFYDYNLPDAPYYSTRHKTMASRDYPRETFVQVTNLENQKRTCVRVNDYVENYGVIADLSSRAFTDLADLNLGLIKVELREVERC